MTVKYAGRAANSGVSSRILGAFVLVAALGLAGCSDVDSMLFGDSGTDTESAGPVASDASSPVPAPTYSAPAPSAPAYSAPAASQTGAIGTVARITPVTIEPGSDTGSAVSKTIAGLRSQLQGLQGSLAANAASYSDLHSSGAGAATAYYEARGRITARLQVGTTRGNPELVAEWNRAQSALDQLSGNINRLNALGSRVATDANAAHVALDQIGAAFNVSGAYDEDHRQLSVLQDETNQTIILQDRLLGEVSADIQRQTAYVANERANLTTLASAIKNGELYGADLSSPMFSSGRGGAARSYAGGSAPLVTIRFDKANVDYQQILYAAINQALQTRPGAAFSIIAVSPTRGTVTAVQLAQTAAQRHAQEVLRSMTDMGVPASRLTVQSQTDPGVTSNEVRVFVR
ncbi:hypothetical protein [Rhizomicrobium electricum]|uniref:Uncharacterized protein n=1 Tax=Rhizomicrobium electricum TaxID=480070 RepID=A0ABN1F574_9PROT|nr:hypothetical protein [Rhizomicrobium electricum]NIJ49476.1 hypothetical protein [Rhizomicrobium electricum]